MFMRAYTILVGASLALSAATVQAQVTFSPTQHETITVTPARNTGLDHIYVVFDTQQVNMSYTAQNDRVQWYRFSNLGGGFAEELNDVTREGHTYTLAHPYGDMGYIIDDGDTRICYWVTDYSRHRLHLEGIEISDVQQCENTTIRLLGTGDAIHYYTVNGQQRTLERDITIEYDTQQWDESASQFVSVTGHKTADAAGIDLLISPPVYAQTYFTASGDTFLNQWGIGQTVRSHLFHPNAIEVNSEAIQQTSEEENSNQLSSGTSGLGGSAPADISFVSYNTEAVMHSEWQMSPDPDFEDITYRITERNFDYTFTEEGTIYVRYIGSNSDGSCEQYGETFQVNIGSSELKCPNAFSPGASEGINDEWKVSYRSIIEFECWIFDRYGNQIFHFTDPSQGWDGKHNGKLVNPGVYYYVIQATGADGRKYKRNGDINILRYKTFGNGGETPL